MRITGPSRGLLPNAILAGTGRAGTTSLFRYLADHPAVCPSSVKEVHFFDQTRSNCLDAESLERYESYFRHCTPDARIRLEATPQYLYGGKETAETIRRVMPGVKLIFTLREPVSRSFTIFRAFKLAEPEIFGELSFDDFVTIGLDGLRAGRDAQMDNRARRISRLLEELIVQGHYARFLAEYWNVFRPEQLCIVFFDDIGKDVRAVMRRICGFLHIDPHFYDSYTFHVENKMRSFRSIRLHRVAFEANMRLERWLNRYPAVRRTVRDLYTAINEQRNEDDRLSDHARRRLQEVYEPYNGELAALLARWTSDAAMPAWIVSTRDDSRAVASSTR